MALAGAWTTATSSSAAGRCSTGCPVLRLERAGDEVRALCSADGQQWYRVGQATFAADAPLLVGLHAIGTDRPHDLSGCLSGGHSHPVWPVIPRSPAQDSGDRDCRPFSIWLQDTRCSHRRHHPPALLLWRRKLLHQAKHIQQRPFFHHLATL